MTQPPQPAQQPPQPTAVLALTIQGSMFTSNMITPSVSVNGYSVPASYGRNDIPLYAGSWHVEVVGQWLRRYGQAAIDVDLVDGQTLEVFYAAPVHQFTTGSIGIEKQKRKGKALLLGILAVALLVVVLAVLAGALG